MSHTIAALKRGTFPAQSYLSPRKDAEQQPPPCGGPVSHFDSSQKVPTGSGCRLVAVPATDRHQRSSASRRQGSLTFMLSENRIQSEKRRSGTAISTGISASRDCAISLTSPSPLASKRPKRLIITRSAPSLIAPASCFASSWSRVASSLYLLEQQLPVSVTRQMVSPPGSMTTPSRGSSAWQ